MPTTISTKRLFSDFGVRVQADLIDDDKAAHALATRIAMDGTDAALKKIRFARFGGLDVVDPTEVDSFLDLHRLIQEYQKQPQRVPLPIAVFSPPGEPKVFCVQQVVDAIVPLGLETCIFNLSSFVGVDALNNAFHHVREIGSSGKTPLVLWEDFDLPLDGLLLGWLRYFNPAIESGSYADGTATYQVGNAIFAFLSGSAGELKQFQPKADNYRGQAQFRDAGGPIFLSCLKGYLEILGVHRHQTEPDHDENPTITVQDRYCVIRRAVWLRHCLGRRTPWLFHEAHDAYTLNIDLGVLNAFLNVRWYNHGFRSMESIIGMSALTGKLRFAPDSLPSSSQLDLHVNGREFLALVHGAKQSIQP